MRVLPFVCLGSWLFAAPSQQPGSTPIAQEKSNPVLRHVNNPGRHAIDHARPEEHLLARSRDGGQTWSIEHPAAEGALIPVGQALHGVMPPGLKEKPWQDCPGDIDFTHPDFALTVRLTTNGNGCRSRRS